MSLNVSGHNISDIYVGEDKINSIFVGEDLVYTAEKPFYDYFGFQIDDPTETASVGFEQFVTDGADMSKFPSYTIPTLYYSYDRNTWSAYTLGTGINIGSGYSYDAVYFKGDNLNTWFAYYMNSETYAIYNTYLKGMFTGSNVSAIGNIMALRYSTPTPSDPIPCDYCYQYMFYGCTSLTTAPELPATSLANVCYSSMFQGCTGLTEAPELPATTLTASCYAAMFSGCTSLTEAPELPATTMTSYCYRQMFYNCTSLTTAPELPATTLASNCYGDMFYGCTSLTTAPPELPATTLEAQCYSQMFSRCTSLTEAPELPATTLASRCYSSMFSRCTSLIEAPELPATTLSTYCYQTMFQNCFSLTTIHELPATTLADACYSGMFSGCANLEAIPQLPATTLPSQCYGNMFGYTTDAEFSTTNPGIRANSTQTATCPYEYRVPYAGTGSASSKALDTMFTTEGANTGFTPSINTTFYISVSVLP